MLKINVYKNLIFYYSIFNQILILLPLFKNIKKMSIMKYFDYEYDINTDTYSDIISDTD